MLLPDTGGDRVMSWRRALSRRHSAPEVRRGGRVRDLRHLLSALVFGLWWWLAFPSDDASTHDADTVLDRANA